MTEIALRRIEDADLDALFLMQCDRQSVHMAAFTPTDPSDREAFNARMSKQRKSPEITQRAVTSDGDLVGSIASFVIEGDTEITYWIDRSVWRQGIASRALALFLDIMPVRPLRARAASDNIGSLKTLRKAGFAFVGTQIAYATARNAEIEETILRLG